MSPKRQLGLAYNKVPQCGPLRYPSPLWGLIPLGLVAFGINPGSRHPPTAPPLSSSPHRLVTVLSFEGLLQRAPSGLSILGRRTRLRFHLSLRSLFFCSRPHFARLGQQKKESWLKRATKPTLLKATPT